MRCVARVTCLVIMMCCYTTSGVRDLTLNVATSADYYRVKGVVWLLSS